MGTRKFCPTCGKLTNVKVIPAGSHIFFNTKARNWWRSNEKVLDFKKFHYFARRLKCLNCNTEWNTCELDMADFNQLLEEASRLTTLNEILLDKNDMVGFEIEDLKKTIEELKAEQKETFDALVEAETELSELRSGLNVLRKNMFFDDLPTEDKGQSTEVIKSNDERFQDVLIELSNFDFDKIDINSYSELDQEKMTSTVKQIDIILKTIAEENGIKIPG